MARNISLVEPSFDCLSERMLKNKIVCIDEFDASRSVILDSLIDRALDLRADYLQLFLQVYRGATTHQISRELETVRKTYEAGRTITWEKLLKEAQDIYQEGALHYSMKTVDTAIDKGRNFLFHDTSYHTVLDGNRTHIRAVCNQTDAQVQIHFEGKDEYYAHQDEPRIVLQNLFAENPCIFAAFSKICIRMGRILYQAGQRRQTTNGRPLYHSCRDRKYFPAVRFDVRTNTPNVRRTYRQQGWAIPTGCDFSRFILL